MNKSEYRDLFIKMKPYVKFNSILKEVHVSPGNFTHFLRYENDYTISIDKLNLIYKAIMNKFDNFA